MIIKSPMNAMHNVTNPYQGTEKRVLCLCSAGLLRSPTAAFVLQHKFGYNTRAAGVTDYSLIPVSQALLKWADEIVCVNQETYDILSDDIKRDEKFSINRSMIVLDIPDVYPRMDYELQEIILQQYKEKLIEREE